MIIITLLIASLFSVLATAIMGYTSMATPIGPWIETTLVLFGMLIFYGLQRWYTKDEKSKALALATASGGIGGIVATAAGFSFPTYYYLDPVAFGELLASPRSFIGLLVLTILSAGAVGMVLAHYFEYTLIEKQALSFPIGELVYKMIMAVDNAKKALQLAGGFIGTQVYLACQQFIPLVSNPLVLLSQRSWGPLTLPQLAIPLDQLPLFWAIGFVTGHVIAIPLLIGLVSKFFIIEPLYYFYPAITQFFSHYGLGTAMGMGAAHLSLMDFTIAFSSGLVVHGALLGFLEFPHLIKELYVKITQGESLGLTKELSFPWYLTLGVVVCNGAVLSWLSFSFLAQAYLLLFTAVCTYQLMYIAGKFGIAPLGRFATFVVVPGMMLFGYSALQITLVALYVEIAGGVACDTLFGRKMARLATIRHRSIVGFQWYGLLVSAFAVGIIFWLLIGHFGLGSQLGALAAPRAAGRALLVSIKSFDMGALFFGLIFAQVLSYFRVGSALILGGILMPISYTLMLILGGFSTSLVKEKEDYYPFWSGAFAANSLWMLLQAFVVGK